MCKLTCIISSLGKGSFEKRVKFHHKVKIFGDCSYLSLSKWGLIFHDNNFIKRHIRNTSFSFEKIQYAAHLQGLYSAVKWFMQFHTLAPSFEFLLIIVHDLSWGKTHVNASIKYCKLKTQIKRSNCLTSAGSSGEPILFTLTLEMKPGYNQLFSHYETDLNVAFVQLINFEIIIL